MFGSYFGPPLQVGGAAPEFTARDHNGRAVTLAALRGRPVVLVFYPGDGTPTCTRQLCALRDRWPGLAEAGAAVFGINGWSAKSHRRFIAKCGFPFPLLVDEDGDIAAAYRAGGRVVRRTVYVIGPGGEVRFARRGVPAVEEILAAVRDCPRP
jgi:peroxiredoxin Q/BCP